jgi:RHS repeat-associated protein
MGLETAAYEFEHPGGASVSYNPSTVVRQWTAFGRPLVASGSGEPLPTRFPGQLDLRGSDVRIWDGTVTVAHRDGLYLNRWRVYDPRVGEYLQPDPAAIWGVPPADNSFGYSRTAPTVYGDPLGLFVLPGDPSGLPPGWERDPNHRPPNGERWTHPESGWVLDWDRPQPGKPGWRAKPHWHWVEGPEGCDPAEHLEPGTEVPDPPGSDPAAGDAPYTPFLDGLPIFIFPIGPPIPWTPAPVPWPAPILG